MARAIGRIRDCRFAEPRSGLQAARDGTRWLCFVDFAEPSSPPSVDLLELASFVVFTIAEMRCNFFLRKLFRLAKIGFDRRDFERIALR